MNGGTANQDIRLVAHGLWTNVWIRGRVNDREILATSDGGEIHPEATLTIGVLETGSPVTVSSMDPVYWSGVIECACRLRDWCQHEQEVTRHVAVAQPVLPSVGGMVA